MKDTGKQKNTNTYQLKKKHISCIHININKKYLFGLCSADRQEKRKSTSTSGLQLLFYPFLSYFLFIYWLVFFFLFILLVI